jgi:hypothetical protein
LSPKINLRVESVSEKIISVFRRAYSICGLATGKNSNLRFIGCCRFIILMIAILDD